MENAGISPFLAAIRWFPLGQLIAPEAVEGSRCGAGYIRNVRLDGELRSQKCDLVVVSMER
jgi:hypothetical protein